ncbi:MAG TPA: hypothetical protein VFK13_15335 [Gemmatimonadaceae bacterium]|nr:hypothetical protein [Gemmatimonadaceae bacterium]
MQVYTPTEVAAGPVVNKYLAVLVSAKFARTLNEFPGGTAAREKKLTTRALEELTSGGITFRVVPRRRG